jgi:hypothetical protein
MLYFDRLYHKNFETVHQQSWSAIHFLLHIELVLVLQGVAMLILWLVALQGLAGAEARLTAIQGKAHERLYATGADLVGDFRGQLDAFIWKRVPKGVDASKGLEYWNQSLILLGDSYNFIKQDNRNMTARDALDSAFKKGQNYRHPDPFRQPGHFYPQGRRRREHQEQNVQQGRAVGEVRRPLQARIRLRLHLRKYIFHILHIPTLIFETCSAL